MFINTQHVPSKLYLEKKLKKYVIVIKRNVIKKRRYGFYLRKKKIIYNVFKKRRFKSNLGLIRKIKNKRVKLKNVKLKNVKLKDLKKKRFKKKKFKYKSAYQKRKAKIRLQIRRIFRQNHKAVKKLNKKRSYYLKNCKLNLSKFFKKKANYLYFTPNYKLVLNR